VPGLSSFAGQAFHSARWDHDVDLAGKRVAVIGTGASAIQLVPQIQPVVGRLTLFQRTPPWIIPRLDFAYPEVGKQLLRRVPALQKLLRARQYWFREGNLLAFTGKSGRTASSMPTASSTGPT
jgi:cation diffusion facilitator CzcD-associated flavoprotein CzcO